MNASELLVVREVTRQYQPPTGPVVLRGVSLDAQAGQTVAIVGPSGSGKSTLLNVIGSLDRPDSGSVRVDGVEVTALEGAALADYRARRVGFIFQDHHLLPQLTALENALLPTLAGGGGAEAKAKGAELLERLGVAHRTAAFPSEMSGGERQRVAIARALVNGAKLLLCDEPTGNLDRENAVAMVDLFLELARGGVTVLMVTHNLELAGRFERCLELRAGQLVPAGADAGQVREVRA